MIGRLEKIHSVVALLRSRDNIALTNLNNFEKTISFPIFVIYFQNGSGSSKCDNFFLYSDNNLHSKLRASKSFNVIWKFLNEKNK